ncbi:MULTISPECIES: RNA polymerase subunit sigma [unclassified Streptomyces]|uniref:RNA polymerase subunit sigma n=1 Tax=unclassified Streptomyces TaxID=2593676 RepID=UPI0028C433A3|nr:MULTISPECIES: RNA polymerase subunit sigma [unclassified Streptomyces]WNO76548.1 RNA polymerase subunit sigma [Streptomyces sp. AM8-1-1]
MDKASDSVSIAELLDERRHLLNVACSILGTGSEAESAIAETYRQWYELPGPARERIAAPRSWLAKLVASICSADPSAVVLDDPFRTAPVAVAEGQADPDRTELADHARRSLRARRSRPATPRQHEAVVRTVRLACAIGDAPLLASVLADDVTAVFDGGGKVRALTEPVHGSPEVAHSLLTLLTPRPGTTLHTHSVNGSTGIVARYDHRVAAVISLDIAGPHVVEAWVTLNPDKLRSWNPPAAEPGCPGRS